MRTPTLSQRSGNRLTRNAPTHWVAEVTSSADSREKELIRELTPACNRRIG